MIDNNCADRLHKCLLQICDEIKRICNKNDINYFLIGGTLLGAIRHKGIIPWDDDMDVGMLRDDYNRFIEACMCDLDEKYILCHPNCEAMYGVPFAKLRLKGTHFPEDGTPDEINDGIFVDIFPIDRIPDNKIKRFVHKNMISMYTYVLLLKTGYRVDKNKRGKIVSVIADILLRMDKQQILKCLVNWQTLFNNTQTRYYANLCSSYVYGKEIFPVDTLTNVYPILCNGHEYLCPGNPDQILTLLYGNYNQLPDIEKRVFRHATDEIDFGDNIMEDNNNVII